MFLLDTDTCFEILRGNGRVIAQRRGVYAPVVTTEITASELFYGAAKSKDPSANRKVVLEFLRTLPVLPISLTGAQFFGSFRAQLQAAGNLIPDADLWIASISRAVRAKIVTGNTRDLSRVPGVECVDWIHA
ncbi:type II toxin-antitoxin system VapC family toxin [Luteolibacter arcticus]|uniref:Type II toxin-antitoxin system VapC family toxin n=1 Tax=Luteolibacter arcticus TaxID=1581411 RepID=A0ABT3GD73_9BACT|nr:type II toxin-antitoxin system VapC family toxin [Luteolibacter arcticus]MCW1921245.1 type II toxin-antitoxin system VapC family toxin [Luteolibacter arcticus]